jgi:DNA polymerase III gamma/tau subunit
MDDLNDLQARVAAAQEKLRLTADDQRKYGLRLNDVVTIVEGSLARQQSEMKRLQDAAVTLRLESDAARVAESQAKNLYEAALVRLNQLQAQNEQLRNMVLTLLNVIEGRESPSALQAVVQRLENTVVDAPQESAEEAAPLAAAEPIVQADAEAEAAETEEQPDDLSEDNTQAEAVPAEAAPVEVAAEVEAAAEAETAALGDDAEIEDLAAEANAEAAAADDAAAEAVASEDAVAEADAPEDAVEADAAMASADTTETEISDPAADMVEAVEEDVEAEGGDVAAMSEDMPEDIGALSMNGHRDFVTDADEIVASEAQSQAIPAAETAAPVAIVEMKTQSSVMPQAVAQPSPEDETLVTALLDAEKALIEAGASGVANVNSPVAEIIRRISLRTREFSEASGV